MKLYKKIFIIISVVLLFLTGCGNSDEALGEYKQGKTKLEKESRKIAPYVELANEGILVMETDVIVKNNEVLVDSYLTHEGEITIKYIDDGKVVLFTWLNQALDRIYDVWFIYVNDTFYAFLLARDDQSLVGFIPSTNINGYYECRPLLNTDINISTFYKFYQGYWFQEWEMEYLEAGKANIDGFDYTYEEYLHQGDNVRFFFDENDELAKYNIYLANGERVGDTGIRMRKPAQEESDLLDFVYQRLGEEGIQVS